ncbi:MAG TPA: hypothetical protein VMU94_17280 [Streptosporangiaceae bacterium]|nr:hypothetical protein [Streptosporangiaceae bacterium]
MTVEAAKRDIVFLLADQAMEQVVLGFLGRQQFHRSLGCAKFTFNPRDIIVSQMRDSGMPKHAYGLLKSYERTHQRAVVMVDAAWTGCPGATMLKESLGQSLSEGWEEFAVIVIEPELEAWIMNDNSHLHRMFRCPENYREILAGVGHWPVGAAKPPDPKAALDYLRKKHKVRVFNAEFGKLAAVMSVRHCQDAAFIQLRDQLRAWFPKQP